MSEMNRLLNWFVANGVDQFNAGAMVGGDVKNKTVVRDPDGVRACARWMSEVEDLGQGFHIRPARFCGRTKKDWPVIFIDLDTSMDAGLGTIGLWQSIIIETSPNHYQAWIAVSQSLSEYERYLLQCVVSDLVGETRASTSGEHFGRMPGSLNFKPDYANSTPRCRVIAESDPDVEPLPACFLLPSSLSTVSQSAKIATRKFRGFELGDKSESGQDFKFVINMLRKHINSPFIDNIKADIFKRLVESASAREKPNPVGYVTRTIAAAVVIINEENRAVSYGEPTM
jgi:hypothetical protein